MGLARAERLRSEDGERNLPLEAAMYTHAHTHACIHTCIHTPALSDAGLRTESASAAASYSYMYALLLAP